MKALKNRLVYVLTIVSIALLVVRCAKRGNPTGGPEDVLPPVVLKSSTPNFNTNFKGNTVILNFNELVKFKDLQKQLIISPPMLVKPEITPQAGVAKRITIRFKDTLQDNTTYTINFGQSIVDNNEENPLSFYKYVFSTGPVIDSLKIAGKVSDALSYKTDPFVNIMLYEMNDAYTDSTIFKKAPNYVVGTLDSLTTFTLENLRAGTYRMVALKEKNVDFKYNPKTDRIGFISEPVVVPTDAIYNIQLFDPVQESTIKRPTHEGATRYDIGYTGKLDSLKIEPLDKSLIAASRITKMRDKDTLQYWFKPPITKDTVRLRASYKDFNEETYVVTKKRKADSLQISKVGSFSLREPLQLQATTPMQTIDDSRILLIRKDSTKVNFKSSLDFYNNVVTLNFTPAEKENYKLQLLPGAITDFYGKSNDTLNLSYNTQAIADYCSITVTLKGVKDLPAVVEIVKEDLKIVASQVALKDGVYAFNYLTPGSFYIRIVYDKNLNGVYDPGDFLKNLQPEKVVYKPDVIKLLANRDARETVVLD